VRRVVVAAVAVVAGACGTTTTAPSETTVHAYDFPKHDVPRSQDTPESFVVPTTTTTKPRASRSKPRPVEVRGPRAVTGDVWEALAFCESGMRQFTPGPYHSYFQWNLATYASVGGEGMPEWHDYEYQKALAQKLQARSGWGQWPTCARRLGLR
jgi:hypothetical protein